jgi:hypothetical protein
VFKSLVAATDFELFDVATAAMVVGLVGRELGKFQGLQV